jgi:ABC-type branched-subunit amino acid transport system substrate-binding protein
MYTFLKRSLALLVAFSFSSSLCAAENSVPRRVGVLLPLSGPLTEMGKGVMRGFEMYTKDYPTQKLSFLFEDHRYDGKTAVTAIHGLRGKTGVDMAVVWGNAPSRAVAPVAEQRRIPTITISNNPDAKDRRFVTSVGFSAKREADRMAEHFKTQKTARLAAVTVDLGNALEVVRLIGEAFEGGVLEKVVSTDEVDFKTPITLLKSRQVDGLVLFLLPQQALTFLNQAKQLNYFPAIVGGDVFALESFRKEASRLSETLRYVYGSVDPAFIARIERELGDSSYFFEVATGYSVAAIVASLAEHAPDVLSSDDPFARMREVSLKDLPLPSITYKEDSERGRRFEVDISVYDMKNHADAEVNTPSSRSL